MFSPELTKEQKKQLLRITYTIDFIINEFEKLSEITPQFALVSAKLAFLETIAEELGFEIDFVREA